MADKIEQGLFVYKGLRCEAHSYKLLFDVICNPLKVALSVTFQSRENGNRIIFLICHIFPIFEHLECSCISEVVVV